MYGNGIGVPLVGRGTTRCVSIVAEISKPNIFVDMIKALPSGMKELEKFITKTSSTFGRLHKHLRMRFTMYQSQRDIWCIEK